MSLSFGFYNSVGGDRLYNATQVSSIFDGIIIDGVFASIGDTFMVVPSANLSIAVGSGRAWFNHTWTFNDSDLILTLDPPDALLPRIDAIVLEINSEVAIRANSIKIIKGTPATIPANPTLTNTATIHQYPLAYISVPVGLAVILASHITNMVGTASCPFVTGPLSVVTTNDLIAQWDSEFTEWFEHIMEELSQEAAGNLQLQIDDLNADRTRSFFVPVINVDTGGEYLEMTLGETTTGFGRFGLPTDFVGDLVIKPLMHASRPSTQLDASSHVEWRKINEEITSQEIDTAIVRQTLAYYLSFNPCYNSPAPYQLNIPDVDVEIGDIFFVSFTRTNAVIISPNGHLYFYGWLVEYTADR